MAEYDIAFGEKLAAVAASVIADGLDERAAQRTVLYLSWLSAEISLKAMLEQAGKPTVDIRGRSHNLSQLLGDLDKCTVEAEVASGVRRRVPASRLRSCVVKHAVAESTVGKIIEAESQGASRYPNFRYGEELHHFPPEANAQMAASVAAFARQHWHNIRAH